MRNEGKADYAGFARWVIEQTAFAGCGLDGGDVQDKALRFDVLREVPGGYDPNVHGDGEGAEEGDDWYVFVEPVGADR